MTPFRFQTTPSIVSALGATERMGVELKARGVRRAMLVTDAGVHEHGLTAAAEAGLAEAGVACVLFTDVVADPPVDLVAAAVAAATDASCDGVCSVGGGSSLDVAKLVAVLADPDCRQPLDEMFGVDQVTGSRLPLVLAPTTAGTGSEVTPISIVTTGAAEKKGVVAPQLLPDVALLDAELTVGLPKHVTAATGVDAMVHAIEAYTSKHKKNPVSDALAREALALLSRNIRAVCDEGENREARGAMLLGSMLAGMAFANAPVAAVHALAYPLGGLFHVPHGLSNALVLPHVLAFNAPGAAGLYAELAPIVFPDLADAAEARRVDGFVEGLAGLSKDIGLQTRISEVGVAAEDVDRLAEDAMRQTRLLVNNPRELTLADAKQIYRAAL